MHVNLDLPARSGGHARRLEAQSAGIWRPAGAEHDLVGGNGLSVAQVSDKAVAGLFELGEDQPRQNANAALGIGLRQAVA